MAWPALGDVIWKVGTCEGNEGHFSSRASSGPVPHLSLCGESPSESKESRYCRPGRWGSA
ncbi:hypothetical protein EYF80_044976 [Liparis tanakae]|uniref:Uncharacterized protein n=1 Tax=Liparis tanakae TaxID=230148 RepID=A0A4Z2FU83_9TELE|nr:hypothetical protein EYF80_044976 [Liparis tanakae]